MKKLYFLLSFGLCACASDDASRLVGQWNEMTDGAASLVAGMELKENGEFVPSYLPDGLPYHVLQLLL